MRELREKRIKRESEGKRERERERERERGDDDDVVMESVTILTYGICPYNMKRKPMMLSG